jgi:hypothetical protein
MSDSLSHQFVRRSVCSIPRMTEEDGKKENGDVCTGVNRRSLHKRAVVAYGVVSMVQSAMLMEKPHLLWL